MIPDLVARLGIPGIADVHTHFMPPRVRAKVMAQFEQGGPLIGRPWPLAYRGEDAELVEVLRGLGVRRFTALSYAHRPGMAEFLNDWGDGFADEVPEVLRSATFYPEPGVASYVARRLAAGVRVWKVHVQVGAFDVNDPLLDEAWGLLAEADAPVVLHAGSGPVATAYTGPEPVAALLRRHPRLRLVIAHLGAPEYAEFLALAEQHERVMLDTTMAFTQFFSALGGEFPPALLPRLEAMGEKVLFGSDFPNIPYAYQHQVEVLEALDFGDAWLSRVMWGNANQLFGAHMESDGA